MRNAQLDGQIEAAKRMNKIKKTQKQKNRSVCVGLEDSLFLTALDGINSCVIGTQLLNQVIKHCTYINCPVLQVLLQGHFNFS